MSSRVDAIALTFTPLNGARRRLRLEPRSDGVGNHTSKRTSARARVAGGRAGAEIVNWVMFYLV